MNRTILRTTTAVAAVSAAALFFPAVASAAPLSAEDCAQISTLNQPNGWGNPFSDEADQAGKHVATQVVDGDGSLELTTVAPRNRAASYHEVSDLKLSEVAGPLKFQSNGPANWQVRVTGANTIGANASADGFATFVWSGDGTQDASTSDQWWATRNLEGYDRGEKGTLDDLAEAAGADTQVNHYGISVEGPEGTKANIDNVQFNGCTTNFKAVGAAEDDGGAFGSLGGFGLANLIPGLPS
ncbi:hypothetical protein [Williamsia soli]|uniref:hypothetical protein n=1 Tax=Williamsia soli TaxID=364929 RepID=UPI001A9CDC9F|nr:hypothetical protein [Williamsia soli]